MKSLFIYITAIMFWMNSAMSACDWKSVRKEGSNYVYSVECHKEVGKIKNKKESLEKANVERKKQVEKLTKTVELKDLALEKADERSANWRKESYNQHDRLLKQKELSRYNDWWYFGGGIGLSILSIWAAGQIKKK